MKNLITLLLISLMFACSQDQEEHNYLKEKVKTTQNDKAATNLTKWEGAWILDLDGSQIRPNVPTEILHDDLTIIQQGSYLLVNGDTLDIVNPKEAVGRTWYKMQHLLYSWDYLEYREFINDYNTQTSYLVTAKYTK